MVPMCRQLATTYKAGIPVLQGLELASRQTRQPKVRNVLRQMAFDIRQGDTLHAAAQHQSLRLPRFFVELLGAGETGGRLDVMLDDLADYYEDRQAMQRQVASQMVYPIILLVISWLLIPFALEMVSSALKSTGAAVNIGAHINDWAIGRVFSALRWGVVFAVIVVLSRLGIFQWFSGAITTFVWPFSRVARKMALARFFRTFSLLLSSGMNTMAAIQRSASVINNPYIERDLLKAIPAVREGATLSDAFGRCRYITPAAHEMLIVGEQSGELDNLLRKLSQYFHNESMHELKVAMQIGVQVFMLAIMVGIGYFIIKFYMTLYGGIFNEFGI
jgi:type IV pilus assembly protein PilC